MYKFISDADEILKNLEIERNFYEMKQILPLNYDAFGEEDGKNIIEYCNEDELDKWRSMYHYAFYIFIYVHIFYIINKITL